MKFIKNLFLVGSLVASLSASAATTSLTLPAGGFTNIITLNNGSVKVTQFVLTATTATNVSVQAIDTYTNSLLYTNAAYSNILSYSTNFVSTYTNFFGVTTLITNANSLVDITNSVAGSTNSFPVRITLSTAASTSTKLDQVNYYFNDGIWITNSGSGTASVTITYQQ